MPLDWMMMVTWMLWKRDDTEQEHLSSYILCEMWIYSQLFQI